MAVALQNQDVGVQVGRGARRGAIGPTVKDPAGVRVPGWALRDVVPAAVWRALVVVADPALGRASGLTAQKNGGCGSGC